MNPIVSVPPETDTFAEVSPGPTIVEVVNLNVALV
jgi:hypothetical protein